LRFQRYNTGVHFTPNDFESSISQFMKENFPIAKVERIGIAICGLMNDKNQVELSEIPGIKGWNPRECLHKIFGCEKVAVVNDAVAALNKVKLDYIDQPNSKYDGNVAVIVVGTGIGSSFLVEGKILKGSIGWAGGLGTAPILISKDNERLKTVTLDHIAGGRAILSSIAPTTPQSLISQLELLKNQGRLLDNIGEYSMEEKRLISIIKEAGYALGVGIATVINIFNPSLIVLAGGVLNFPGIKEFALQSAKENTQIMTESWNSCQIIESPHRNELVALGAMYTEQ